MTESTQIQTTENNNTGVVKMDPAPVSPSPSEQQYALKWNDFQTSILSSFRHLRDEEDFVDVTLACDQRSFTAHKVVLSACSPYFRKLLKANPCEHPIVILRDVRAEDVENLLRFMYNGEVNIGHEQLSDFLKTAQLLQVRGLADVTGPVTKTSTSSVNTLTSSTTTPPAAVQELKASPTSTSLPWDISENRSNHLTPPPQKRIKSADLYRAQHGISPERLLLDKDMPSDQHPLHRERDRNRDRSNSSRETSRDRDRERDRDRDRSLELRDSLLGQALESGGQQLPVSQTHPDLASLQAQSTGEDSNSSDTEPSDRGDGQLDGTMDSMNGSMDNQRSHSFPFLGLQGIPGLLPGPSGIHGADNFDIHNKFGTITIKKEELSIDMSPLGHHHHQLHQQNQHQCRRSQQNRQHQENSSHQNNHRSSEIRSRDLLSSPSPTPSTASSNGSSMTSSAISLAMHKSNNNHNKNNCTNPTIAALQHEHQQLQQQHQQQQQHRQSSFFGRFHQHYDEDEQKHLDDLQTHHQMTANLFMARTIALSTTRDLPDMLQHQAAAAAISTASPTNSTTAATTTTVAGNFLLPCPLCETPLEPRLFRQHLDRHYPRDSPVCPVLQCGRRFAHPNSVRNHMRIKHTIQWTKMKAMRSSGGPFTVSRRMHEIRVRATDPRPCPKCGKIYRSAHTLRTHLEDKHTVCPGYRCVLCGTVAKSRNSLHSHMSRQHRGISTKDLPVLPMPNPFDPDLASRLLAKAGVKISPAELRARASPTSGTRRGDSKLDLRGQDEDTDDPEDLTTGNNNNNKSSSRYSDSILGYGHSNTTITRIPHDAMSQKSSDGLSTKDHMGTPLPPTSGPAGQSLLDTYLQFFTEGGPFGLGLGQEHAAAALHAAKMAQLNAMGHGLDKLPVGLLPPHLDLSKITHNNTDISRLPSSGDVPRGMVGSIGGNDHGNGNSVTIEPMMNRRDISPSRRSNVTPLSNNGPDIRRDSSEPMDLGLDNNQSGSNNDGANSDGEDANYSEDEGVHNT